MAVLLHSGRTAAMVISDEERGFFIALGEGMAQLRNEQDMTQAH